jgi:hypothetical protein
MSLKAKLESAMRTLEVAKSLGLQSVALLGKGGQSFGTCHLGNYRALERYRPNPRGASFYYSLSLRRNRTRLRKLSACATSLTTSLRLFGSWLLGHPHVAVSDSSPVTTVGMAARLCVKYSLKRLLSLPGLYMSQTRFNSLVVFVEPSSLLQC